VNAKGEPIIGKVVKPPVGVPLKVPTKAQKIKKQHKELEKEVKEYNPKDLAKMDAGAVFSWRVKKEADELKKQAKKDVKLHIPKDDGAFGPALVPKSGVWTGGDSDWTQPDEPWRDDDDAWPPSTPIADGDSVAAAAAAGANSEEFLEQMDKTDNGVNVAPWEGDADAAPWEEAPPEEFTQVVAVPDGESLVQTAVKVCASKKIEQHRACKEAQVKVDKECEFAEEADCDEKQDSVHKFCDRTAKATLKACFDGWKAAKAAQAE
jgi:hypothetical protein